MTIEIPKREIDKPLGINTSPKRNSFYTQEVPLTEDEKKKLQTFSNILLKNRYNKSI